MKTFNLSDIQTLIEQALLEQPTGDSWLDARYDEQVGIIGHTNPYYRLFWLIAKGLKPEFVVELGSWRGIAASHFAAGNPNAEIITIDIHREDKVAQQHCIEAMQRYPNLTYLNGWTWDNDILQAVKMVDKPLSILYIDAWHEYQYARKEWELYSPLLASSSLVICDDIIENPGVYVDMVKFWEELPGEKFLNDQVHPGINMGFMLHQVDKPKRGKREVKKPRQ